MNLAEFKKEYPDLAAALTEEGRAAGIAEGADKAKAEGHKAGADAERARIQSVLGQSMPGHEALVQTLAFDGKTTAAEAAVQILAAEKAKRGNVLGALKTEGAQLAAVPAGSQADPGAADAAAGDDSRLPIEERCKAMWDKSPAIRGEFATLESYTAYEKAVAAGRVKVLGSKRSA
jgi:hypothetical protein